MEANLEIIEVSDNAAPGLIVDKEVAEKVMNGGDGSSEVSSNANVRAAGDVHFHAVDNNVGGASSSVKVRPPPPFLLKVYDMVHNSETDSIISWNTTGTSFIIWDAHNFQAEILGKYFKHNNLSSFVCQLNTYCFKKISWDRLEFQNEWFQRGKKRWLKKINRRNQITQYIQQRRGTEPPLELTMHKMEKDFEFLKHEHNALKEEMMKLKEMQENAEKEMATLKKKAQCSASRQQKMVMFIKQAIVLQKKEFCWTELAKNHRLNGEESTQKLEDLEVQDTGEISNRSQGNSPSTQSGDMCLAVDSRSHILEKEKHASSGEIIPDLSTSDFLLLEKRLMEDLSCENVPKEEMAKLQPRILIEMKDLIAGPADWMEITKELVDKAKKSEV